MFSAIRVYVRVIGLVGLVAAFLSKVSGRTFEKSVSSRQHRSPLKLRVPSSDIRTYHQVFVDEEYDFSASEEPLTIVDAGANVGLASISFANRFPNATVIAIEPESSNFALLKRNVAPYPRIIPLQAALWSEAGEIDLMDPGYGKWGFVTRNATDDHGPSGQLCHRVRAVTVSNLMEIYGLSSIDILKIDIEGAEREVFGDTTPWLSRVNAIIIELHDRMKPGCSRAFYNGSNGFDSEWQRGENVFVSREGRLAPR